MGKVTEWDLEDPLGRVKGETSRSNHALQDYVDMGPGRSLKGLIRGYKGLVEPGEPNYALFSQYVGEVGGDGGDKPPTKSFKVAEKWSYECKWQARIADHDKLNKERREAIRAERRDRVEDESWEMGGLLTEVGAEFLQEFPKFITQTAQTIVNDDGEPTEVVTVKVNTTLAQISLMLKTGNDLRRLSVNEPTDITEVHGAALISQLVSAMDELAEASQDPADGEDVDGGAAGSVAGAEGSVESDPGEGTDSGGGGGQKGGGSAIS